MLIFFSFFGLQGLLLLTATPVSADPHEVQSVNIAVIDTLNVVNGGLFPTTTGGPTGSFTDFHFFTLSVGNVSLASLGPGGVCGATGCDTVLLNVASYGMYCDINRLTTQQKADLVSFVRNGFKLIIYDSECSTQDYSWLPYPFTTSNPGPMGEFGTLSIVEENTLSSNDPANPHYINADMLGSQIDAVGDMNVMTTFDPNWFLDMSGTNYLGATGPVHTYAKYPSGTDYGLIIYNGLDIDYLYSSTAPDSSTPAGNLAKIWLQELQQPFNPSRLPGGLPVVGITLAPGSATLPIYQTHTVTATVTDLLANPQPGIQVSFSVDSGPNTRATGTCAPNASCTTGANGQVSFTYTGSGGMGIDQIKACFTNQEGQVNCSQNVSAEWMAIVPDDGTVGSGDEDKCFGSTYNQTQESAGQPINTRTGSMEYSFEDLAIQTAAGRLSFERDYASKVTDVYTQTLGYGWTHSLDSRLIFPSDPGGQAGIVIFKAHSVNRYQFTINPDGNFSAYPGLCATLNELEGPPVTYSLKDHAQNEYTFDETGRLMRILDPQGHALYYSYQNGRLIRVSDETGIQFLTLNYDAQGRISSVADHTGREVSFGYDTTSGDLTSATDVRDPDMTWSYRYDDPSHPHFLTQVLNPLQGVEERTEYDTQGRAVRQFNGAGELTLELVYHADGTTTVKDGLENAQTHGYDPRHTLTNLSDALQATTTKIYDSNFRPISVTDPLSRTTSLAWSPDGKDLLSVTDTLSNTTSFAYDARSHLTLSTNPDTSQAKFVYNSPGVTDPLTGVTIYNPAWDEDVLLLEVANYVAVSPPPDANQVTRYTYTSAADAPEPPNLLRRVEAPGSTTCYVYRCNGLSRDAWGIIGCESDRVSQTVNGETTNYVLDQAAGLPQVLSDGMNTYLYGKGRIAQYAGIDPEFFLTDGLDSVRQIADSSGAITLTKGYQPYGEELGHAGSEYSSYGFAGEMTDPSGLIYLRARYYSPYQGRFITKDTWQGNYGRPLSLNGWMYVEGNPVNRVDPSGRCYGPLNFLRNIPVESGICEHLDQAMFIYSWPGSTLSQRNLAAAYIGGWTFSHSALLVGTGGLAVAGGQAAITWITELYAASRFAPQVNQTCQDVSVWLSRPFQRGIEIENQIGRSPELVQNFPVIDRFDNGVATSIKSIDLARSSYQNLPTLIRTVQSYVSTLANWRGANWGGFEITQNMITSRELILAIPPNATQAQLATLSQIQNWAQNLGVTLRIVVIP